MVTEYARIAVQINSQTRYAHIYVRFPNQPQGRSKSQRKVRQHLLPELHFLPLGRSTRLDREPRPRTTRTVTSTTNSTKRTGHRSVRLMTSATITHRYQTMESTATNDSHNANTHKTMNNRMRTTAASESSQPTVTKATTKAKLSGDLQFLAILANGYCYIFRFPSPVKNGRGAW